MNKILQFQRDSASSLDELAHSFPIVGITGPRQSGKTTLAQQHFPNKACFNLEDPSLRVRIENDPKGIIASLGEQGAIFNEVQRFPELLSYLQVETDKQQIKGQFIITGSYNPTLMESITQSLAGRIGLLKLCNYSATRWGRTFMGNLERKSASKCSHTNVYAALFRCFFVQPCLITVCPA